jgi:predicted ABC-type ATPase
MDFSGYDQRPIVVAIAGPNGAGKTTFFHSHLAAAGLPFVSADVLASELSLPPYDAARLADALRRELLGRRESFVFETVFSDPVGDKIAFLEEAVRGGYIVALCYIGLASPEQSSQRVAMRVSQGGPRRSRRQIAREVSAHAGEFAPGNTSPAARARLRQWRPGDTVSAGRRIRSRSPA